VTKTIFLDVSGAGTWTVPSDCSQATIELLGAGGDGVTGAGDLAGGGGGGGQYSIRSNLALTPGSVVNYQVGAHGGVRGSDPDHVGSADSWFVTANTVYAQGGSTGSPASGGAYAGPGLPWTSFSGGNARSGATDTGSPGGGGAGGPNGAGGAGGYVELFPFNSGGGGGGGANGGGNGQDSTGAGGANGGNNRSGTGGGAGSASNAFPGSNGTSGGGGGGGYGSGPGSSTIGGNGSQDTIWTDGTKSYGPGSGGGGGGYRNGGGGNAGGRGGGGGGGGNGTAGGVGTDGLIVITYTPNPDVVPETARGRVYTRVIRKRL
jgi:hypothetical protein